MAKPKTELGQRCPPPPYTRWDQRGKPALLSYLKLIDRKRLCLSLETEDPDIAKRHMRLLVAMSPLRETASGVGLEVPVWVRRLEEALRRTREPDAEDLDDEIDRVAGLDFAELQRQLQEWDKPLGE